MKRYIVTLSFYQHSANDAMARVEAQHIANELNKKNDCSAAVDSIVERPFGKIGNRPHGEVFTNMDTISNEFFASANTITEDYRKANNL